MSVHYWNYLPVSVWKSEAKRRGLHWQHVRDAYNEIRKIHREYESQVLRVRRRAFTESRVSKAHRAFWHGDFDLSDIRGFDILASEVAEESPWAFRSGDESRDLYELMQQNGDDLGLSDNDAWRQALDRVEACTHHDHSQSSDEPF